MKNESPEVRHLSAKIKLKKNALEDVDHEKEWKKDPKYKTELCKSFESKGACVYGNKCRFAHGKNEIFDKSSNLQNYKQKECFSFYKNGFCSYGKRCHFMHSENNFFELNRSYYLLLISIFHLKFSNEIFLNTNQSISINKNTFNNSTYNSPTKTSSNSVNHSSNSTNSNDSFKKIYSANTPLRRLNAFNIIYFDNVRRDLRENFYNCDGQSMLNCNYQNMDTLVSI